MKNVLQFAFLFVVALALNSCSKDEETPMESMPTLEGKWEFSKYVSYNTQSQEELTDYNHRCVTTKDFIQFDGNKTMYDSYSSSDCQSDTNSYVYVVENDIVKFYTGGSIASYSMKILTLTKNQLKMQWFRNAAAKGGTDVYILTRK